MKALVALALVVTLLSIGAAAARSRQVPIDWEPLAPGPYDTVAFFVGRPATSDFAPCERPRFVSAGAPGPAALPSPGLVERFSCTWPRARDKFAPLTWPVAQAYWLAQDLLRLPAP